MTNNLTVGFMGSGHFAAMCLEHICTRVRPMWVITNAPRAAGRGMKMRMTPVHELAQKLSLPVYTTVKLAADTERIAWMRDNTPDVMLVIDFGHMIKEPVLSMARLGCINAHPSRLPEYRGSAPIQRALMDGRTKTAVSLFRLDAGMDSGPLLAQPELEILPEDDAGTLMARAAKVGSEALLHYICDVPDGEWHFTPQPAEGATLAPKIDKSEGRIDWRAMGAEEIVNRIRGIGQAPGVFCMVHGRRLRIRAAHAVSSCGAAGTFHIKGGIPTVGCRSGALALDEVQPEGKKTQDSRGWARGARLEEGEILE